MYGALTLSSLYVLPLKILHKFYETNKFITHRLNPAEFSA